jgi:hypothetical protein
MGNCGAIIIDACDQGWCACLQVFTALEEAGEEEEFHLFHR